MYLFACERLPPDILHTFWCQNLKYEVIQINTNSRLTNFEPSSSYQHTRKVFQTNTTEILEFSIVEGDKDEIQYKDKQKALLNINRSIGLYLTPRKSFLFYKKSNGLQDELLKVL